MFVGREVAFILLSECQSNTVFTRINVWQENLFVFGSSNENLGATITENGQFFFEVTNNTAEIYIKVSAEGGLGRFDREKSIKKKEFSHF